MGATHDKQIQISILLDPPPAGVAGFIPLILGDEADGNTLDGDRVRTYLTPSAVDADETAGFLSEDVANAVRLGFSQTPRPAEIKVGRVDTTATEGYDEALTAIEGIDPDFYGIVADTRLAADQVAIATWTEARDRIFLLQSDDADWITAGIAGDFSAIADYENTAVVFHDTPAQLADSAWCANRLAFSPDVTSAPWDANLSGVQGYATTLTETEQGHAEDNNVNLVLPFGSATTYLASDGVGVNLAGRQISEIVTKHWFKRRLQEAVIATKIRQTGLGQKIPVSLDGVALVQPLVENLFDTGEDTGHFVPGQTSADFPIPTAADIEAARIRGTGSAQLATSAGTFDFDLVFSRQPVVETE